MHCQTFTACRYRVIAPDLRGFGGSYRANNEADYNVYHIATDVINLINHYGEKKVRYLLRL
jgi:pimeloyl-ACP methyl ester carboxylesterase